ncbi:hypothetical protein LCGC14_2737360 [marine sediment metagenome]|uniref:Uncharacterized protein n=1 Tax=marine sediment metagenome TaxID=412755 RepID=A0A0F8Z5G6_9ZZZZ
MDFKENKGCGERLPFSAKLFCGRIQWGKLRLCPSCKNNSSSAVSKDKDKEPDDGGARTDSGSDFKLSDGVFTMEIKGQLCDFLFKGDIKEFIRRLKDKFCCGGEESCELWCKEIDKLSGFGEKNG